MNKWIATATALSGMTFLLHVIGGETTVHKPLLAEVKNLEMRAYVSVLWHIATAVLLTNTLALAVASRKKAQASMVWLLIGQNTLFAAIFAFFSLTRMGDLLALPQWTLFLAIALLAYVGQKSLNRSLAP